MKKVVPHPRHLILIGILVFFAVVLIRNAWLSDDAYITFRTVDNLVNGHGLTWNPSERVQGYTNPLWMFLVSAVYFFTGEIYFTSLILQMAVTLAAILLLAGRVACSQWHAVFCALVLILSKAFIDFSTSGLENPLVHLALVIFFALYARAEPTDRTIFFLSLLVSLGLFTRMDTVFLYLPPLGLIVAERIRQGRFKQTAPKAARALITGLGPFVLWELFSLFYYGFLFPNTAYAKLNASVPTAQYAAQGIYYLFNSLRLDPITLLATCTGAVIGFYTRDPKKICVAAGIVLHLLYVVRVGGDFMSGRFLTPALLVSVILLARTKTESDRVLAVGLACLMVAASAMVGFPTLNRKYYKDQGPPKDNKGIVDHRRVMKKHTSLLRASRGQTMPNHPWVTRGLKYRENPPAPFSLGGVGFTGFYAGPEVHIVDMFGLTEPLLARLPCGALVEECDWRIGHFKRQTPAGYIETLHTGQNKIQDPSLAAYYDKLAIITRGDLFSAERLKTILKMNLGAYDSLLEEYINRQKNKRRASGVP